MFQKIDVVWDMETNDPDDFLTLLLLLGHPCVNLKAITVMPGSRQQIGLIRRTLEWFDVDIPVGAYSIDKDGASISQWHDDAYGKSKPSDDALPGGEVLHDVCDENTVLITGSSPRNLGTALKYDDFYVGRWVAQGGFAGEGVVPPAKQPEKFKGLWTVPSFNMNGAPNIVLRAQSDKRIGKRYFVSENVCHGVVYDSVMHEIIGAAKDQSQSLALIWKGMDVYLRTHHEGRVLPDPLAACCAINPEIGEWAEVQLYREKGEWGSRLQSGTKTWIITDYHRERFIETLLMVESCGTAHT